MAKKSSGRSINGILLLNKPTGISSNKALQQVKYLYQARKAGHTGSLDNLASGLLPICLGEATKLSGFLLEADKKYQVTAILGVATTTGDSEGEVVTTGSLIGLDNIRIVKVIKTFVGTSQQVPPMYSALKHHGQPLYKLARRGIVVERAARNITISKIDILAITENSMSLEVHCSKGTYIRTLVEDIGKILGCGAHVSALHRIGVSNYYDMIDFPTLHASAEQGLDYLDKLLLPMHSALQHQPKVKLTPELASYIKTGQAVQVANSPITDDYVGLFVVDNDSSEQFIGIGKVLDDGRIAPKRLVNI
ncbi:MAG: tRNA pseudouridine(55) synthase TruB [Thiomargarita sp.]|nr:tRNA pseudouridine(55) synthase TruB [Thiomargarita sp.]